MTESYIGIGSNLGDRKINVEAAIKMLGDLPKIEVEGISPLYETKPVGGPSQGRFLNGVIKIKTLLLPKELLNSLKAIEDALGRIREVKDGPRTIDLDILTYGDISIEEEGLVIPHPRMNERDFVKRPLNDLLNNQ